MNNNDKIHSYKNAIEELENIVKAMENESIDVDELAAKVKRGAELIRFCKSKLKDTEDEVSDVLKTLFPDSEGKSKESGIELNDTNIV